MVNPLIWPCNRAAGTQPVPEGPSCSNDSGYPICVCDAANSWLHLSITRMAGASTIGSSPLAHVKSLFFPCSNVDAAIIPHRNPTPTVPKAHVLPIADVPPSLRAREIVAAMANTSSGSKKIQKKTSANTEYTNRNKKGTVQYELMTSSAHTEAQTLCWNARKSGPANARTKTKSAGPNSSRLLPRGPIQSTYAETASPGRKT